MCNRIVCPLSFSLFITYIYTYITSTQRIVAQLDYPSRGKEMFGNGLSQGAAIALRKGHSQTVLLGHDVVCQGIKNEVQSNCRFALLLSSLN